VEKVPPYATLHLCWQLEPARSLKDVKLARVVTFDSDQLTPETDIVVGKTDNAAFDVPGKVVTYTITVENQGPRAGCEGGMRGRDAVPPTAILERVPPFTTSQRYASPLFAMK
jgi:hypothetical protein